MTENIDDPAGQSAADMARRAAIDAVHAHLDEIRRLATCSPTESSPIGHIGVEWVGLDGQRADS